MFEWLENGGAAAILARDRAALVHAVTQSCVNKAAVVAADEREGGVRATLNLGHTFGHAVETATGYGAWLHGEAVAAGTAMAADLSEAVDNLEFATAEGLVADIVETLARDAAGALVLCGLAVIVLWPHLRARLVR